MDAKSPCLILADSEEEAWEVARNQAVLVRIQESNGGEHEHTDNCKPD